MRATIEYDFDIDGECPSEEMLENAIWELVSVSSYIGSEGIDGTEDWGIEISGATISIDKTKGKMDL